MLDIAWPELVVIGVVALVAIGPKDLPKVMHMMGKWVGKLRAAAHDIHRAVEHMSYEAERAEEARKAASAPPPDKPASPDHDG
ncbi:MAG: twin-arginine translocase subunit TatB [Alphaproteobacteria bacterium]|nr:twin-arginine translocase subunit TatB [Alphaproteobacteria bacterium]